jgi:hypothetical protein
MHESPLPAKGLPGPALTDFIAGATVFRRSAYLQAGGYEPRFFIGGEARLLALDLMTLGFSIVYAPTLVVCQYPTVANHDSEPRRALVARNDLWTAWLRRHPRVVARRTLAFAALARSTSRPLQALSGATRGLPWALHNRRIVPPHVEALCDLAERARGDEPGLAADSLQVPRPVARSPRVRSAIRSLSSVWHR